MRCNKLGGRKLLQESLCAIRLSGKLPHHRPWREKGVAFEEFERFNLRYIKLSSQNGRVSA